MSDKKNITTIYPNVLSNVETFIKLDPTKENSKIEIPVKFANHYDLITQVQGFINIIKILSLNDEYYKEASISIANLCDLIDELLPLNEMEFLDRLLIKEDWQDDKISIAINSLLNKK